jgi:hypothetical protein
MSENPLTMRTNMRKSFNRTKPVDEMLVLPQVNINKMNSTQLWPKTTSAMSDQRSSAPRIISTNDSNIETEYLQPNTCKRFIKT